MPLFWEMWVATHREMALWWLCMAEALCIPLPSGWVIPLCGRAAVMADIPFAAAVVATTAGTLSGQLIFYAIGRWMAERLSRVGWVPLWWGHIEDTCRYLRPGHLFWGQWMPLARCILPFPAGLARMPVGRLLALCAGGAGLWNTAWLLPTFVPGGGWLFFLPLLLTGCSGFWLVRQGRTLAKR